MIAFEKSGVHSVITFCDIAANIEAWYVNNGSKCC